MFAGLGVIGCLFSFYLFLGKRFVCNANVVTTRLLYLVFFKPDTVYYNFSIYCLHIPSPTMLSVALIILPVLQEVYAQGYHLPSIFYNIQTKKVQWASWCALFVIVLGVLLSESRAGSISIFTVLVIYFIHQNKNKFHYKNISVASYSVYPFC